MKLGHQIKGERNEPVSGMKEQEDSVVSCMAIKSRKACSQIVSSTEFEWGFPG